MGADQNVRLKLDDPNDPRHGYLEYQVQGLWGAVCAATLDINTATVACKQLGFTGGVPYRPNINRYRQVPYFYYFSLLLCSAILCS